MPGAWGARPVCRKRRALLWQVFATVTAELRKAGKSPSPGCSARWPKQCPSGSTQVRSCRGGRVPGHRHPTTPLPERNGWKPRQCCSLPAIWGSAFFSSPSRGSPLGWMCAVARARSTSTTAHRTRSVPKPIGYFGPEVSDVDGLAETRKGTISVFNGPIQAFVPSTIPIGKPGRW